MAQKEKEPERMKKIGIELYKKAKEILDIAEKCLKEIKEGKGKPDDGLAITSFGARIRWTHIKHNYDGLGHKTEAIELSVDDGCGETPDFLFCVYPDGDLISDNYDRPITEKTIKTLMSDLDCYLSKKEKK